MKGIKYLCLGIFKSCSGSTVKQLFSRLKPQRPSQIRIVLAEHLFYISVSISKQPIQGIHHECKSTLLFLPHQHILRVGFWILSYFVPLLLKIPSLFFLGWLYHFPIQSTHLSVKLYIDCTTSNTFVYVKQPLTKVVEHPFHSWLQRHIASLFIQKLFKTSGKSFRCVSAPFRVSSPGHNFCPFLCC